jgi:hypothetical protein
VELKEGRRDTMKDNFFWEEQAIDLKEISKDVLSKTVLSKRRYSSIREKLVRVSRHVNSLSEEDKKAFKVIESRLKVLNPDKRIQVNLEFYTKKVLHFQNALETLKKSLEDASSISEKNTLQEKISKTEKDLEDAENLKRSLLA